MMFYSQRIALLGNVTALVSRLVAQEDAERAILRNLLAEGTLAVKHFVPFDSFRVGMNRVETDEHEARWELVHEEAAVHREMFALHQRSVYDLFASLREAQRLERAVLEREAVLRMLEMVCHREMQLNEIAVQEWKERSVWSVVSRAREELHFDQREGREVIENHETVQWKQAMRHFHRQLEEL